MRTRTAGAVKQGKAIERRAARTRGRGELAGWRSHTFSDGVCSVTLTTTLGTEAVERLRTRLRELCARGCERLIVDVTAAVEPAGEVPHLLADVLARQAPSCEMVVVMPRGSRLDRLLPARVAVVWSLTDARRLLAAQPPNGRSAPGEGIPPRERHVLAVRQALRWVEQIAGTGDYDSALRGLANIERVDGTLPEDWQARRRAWLAASEEQAAS
jgi:hypothetical protein